VDTIEAIMPCPDVSVVNANQIPAIAEATKSTAMTIRNKMEMIMQIAL